MPVHPYDNIVLHPGNIVEGFRSVGLFYKSDSTSWGGLDSAIKDLVEACVNEAKKIGIDAVFNFKVEFSQSNSTYELIAYGLAAVYNGKK